MRIISLVPSWTETLIEMGIPVVGRTRFCLHPKQKVSSVPALGGTKTADWQKIKSLKPDLLILDEQENPKDFSEQGIEYWSSNVRSLETLSQALESLSSRLGNAELLKLKSRVDHLQTLSPQSPPQEIFPGCEKIIKSWNSVSQPKFHYIIWREPWMEVTRETYIGSVLSNLGILLPSSQDKSLYPELDSLQSEDNHVYLFSSEPYPFRNKFEELKNLNVSGAIVNGESFSWFGVRSIRFLEEARGLSRDP